MKNYLSNLMARETNEAEVLQPRLASRFEPHANALKTEVLEPDLFAGDVEVADLSGAAFRHVVAEPLVAQPEIPVESPTVERPPAETTSDSSGPLPAIFKQTAPPQSQPEKFQPTANVPLKHTEDKPIVPAALTTLTSVARERHEPPTASAPGDVQSVSSLELPAPEIPSDEDPRVNPSSPAPLATKPRLPNRAHPVAVADETEQQMPTESSPEQIIAKRPPRAALTKTNQTLRPAASADLQPPDPQTKTETGKETANPAVENSPAISNTPHSKRQRSPGQPKLRPTRSPVETDGPSAGTLPLVVSAVPEVVRSPAVKSAEKEDQVSPQRSERISAEVQSTPRAPILNTSVVRSPPNNSMDRRMSLNEKMPVETGPTINVTIGRIEVRASTQGSEARPQKQRREQQVLSLDEYLRQRSAGGR